MTTTEIKNFANELITKVKAEFNYKKQIVIKTHIQSNFIHISI